jgi:hypothetical protein
VVIDCDDECTKKLAWLHEKSGLVVVIVCMYIRETNACYEGDVRRRR